MRLKFVSMWTIVLLLSSYLQFFVGLAVPTVSASETPQILINSPPLVVKWQSTVQGDAIEWKISVDKTVEDTTTSRFKIKINESTITPTVYQNLLTGSSQTILPDAENWLKESEYTDKSKVVVTFKTSINTPIITLRVQLDKKIKTELTDEQGTHEVIEEAVNTLGEGVSGPHTIKTEVPIPESPTQETKEPEKTEKSEEPEETKEPEKTEKSEEPEETKEPETTEKSEEPEETKEPETTKEPEEDALKANNSEKVETETTPQEKDDEQDASLQIKDDDTPLPLLKASPLLLPLAGIPTTTDPFHYTADQLGNYPTHNTPNYNSSQTSLSIKNYNYGQVSSLPEGVSTIKSISGNGLTFESGYHDYDDALVKKIVIPTSNPNQFKIQLDMIGDVLQTNQPIDVALVLDRSSSMNNTVGTKTKWNALKDSVAIFASELLTAQNQGNIRLGLAGFGSYASSSTNVPYADIALMSSNNAFTSSASQITGHHLYTTAPTGGATTGSGTPTYLGVDAGYAMLMTPNYGARSGATKVLIVLTDGLPTFGPNDSYYDLTNNVLSLPRTTIDGSHRYSARRTVGNQTINYFVGTGASTSNQSAVTITHATARASTFPTVVKYSIGYDTSGDAVSVLQAIGVNGYFTASSQQQLTDVLKDLEVALTATVQNAVVTDPMSDYVTLSSPISSSALSLANNTVTVIPSGAPNYPSYASQIGISTSDNKITLTNVSLGSTNHQREGYRIEYFVTMKPEYRDGKFYPANKTTHLKNNKTSSPDYLHFAVPSIKGVPPVTTVEFKKVGQDGKSALEDVEFKIYKQNDLETAIQTAISQSNGNVSFTNLSAGDYIIKETHTPTGYEPIADITISITKQSDGSLKVSGLPANGIVTNKLYPFRLILYKKDSDEHPLKGATFKLSGDNLITPLEATSEENGQVVFDNNSLRVGTYTLTETVPPTGFAVSATGPWTVTIGQNQVVTITDKDNTSIYSGSAVFDDSSKRFIITGPSIINVINDFTLKVLKKDNSNQALIGATFKLTGPNGYEESIGGDDQSEFLFTGLRPGAYVLSEVSVPDGYIGLKDAISITIGANGTVTINGEDVDVTLGTNGNQVTLEITNLPKTPLPQTGGFGTLPFIMGGGLLLLIGGVYSYFRNGRKGLNKKKIGKKSLLGLLVIIPVLTSISGTVSAIGNDENTGDNEIVTVILHKLLFDSGTLPDKVWNDGIQNPFLKDYEGLNDASFSVYDVTEEFYNLKSQEPYRSQPVDEANKALQNKLSQEELSGKDPIMTQVTATVDGDKGIASFDLLSRLPNGNNKVYLFVETDKPENVSASSENFVLILPVVGLDGNLLKTIHLYPKNEAIPPTTPVDPTLTKEVMNGRNDFTAGETISYKLTTVIPTDVNRFDTYTLSDLADSNLTLVDYSADDKALAEDGIKVFLEGNQTSNFYTITVLDGQSFEIAFDPTMLEDFAGQTITVTYQMILSPIASYDATDYQYHFPNTAILQPGHHPSLKADAIVTTGGKHFVKIDSQKPSIKLKGAEFIVQNDHSETLVYKDGKFDWVKEDIKGLPHKVVLTSNNDGLLSISGLRYGQYNLVEVKAPSGYIVSSKLIPFEISAYSNLNAEETRLKIVNNKKMTPAGWLPQTGERKSYLLYSIGITLLVLASLILLKIMTRKTMEVYPHDDRKED